MPITWEQEDLAYQLYDNGWRASDAEEIRVSYELNDEDLVAVLAKLIECEEDPYFCKGDCNTCPFVDWVYRNIFDDPYPVCKLDEARKKGVKR